MLTSDRHQPKQYEEYAKDSCQYCRRPSVWQQIGNEKVCLHCGTRVYSPVLTLPSSNENNRRLSR